jgi:hypothetical protein
MLTDAPRFDTDGIAWHAAAMPMCTTGRTARMGVPAAALGSAQPPQELAGPSTMTAQPNHNALIDSNFLETLDVAHA